MQIQKQISKLKAGLGNCSIIWKMEVTICWPLKRCLALSSYHTQQNSRKRLYFFSCFGHDDLRHIEITCKTLNKLLNQRQNWGTKPGFSKFKGQSFNHYVSISLWLRASSDSVHFTTQLRFQNDFAPGTFLWTILHWVSDTCCHSSSHCWALVPTKLAAHPRYT